MKRMYHNRRVVLLMVDSPKEEIRILTFHEAEETTEPLAVLPLSIVEGCYNLMLELLFGMRTRTTERRFWCGIMIPEKCWSGSRGVSAPCQTARTGFWCEEAL